MSTLPPSNRPAVLEFTDPHSLRADLVGGKGANLARLVGGGFTVPPGFTITTQAYRDVLAYRGLGAEIAVLSDRLDYGSAQSLETQTSSIRAVIEAAEIPAPLLAAIDEAYGRLGLKSVAVRSSGTAEDLAEASFAGLHDTFLGILGLQPLLVAIRACWASMWSARATAYRYRNGFNHADASLAVVVQAMVPAEVAGVAFTGNPLTATTDEIVINASLGLGESVVSGVITPDEFVVSANTLKILQKTRGTKSSKVVRSPTGSGTVTIDVAKGEREAFCLGDEQLVELARLSMRVQDFYGGFPQDLEWAYAQGDFYLLQARPVTGAEFSWDECLDDTNINHHVDENWVWTRAFSDSINTGGMTPLNYSARFTHGMTRCWNDMAKAAGLHELAGMRIWKYHRGELYYNCHWEKLWLQRMVFPFARTSDNMPWVPNSWHAEIAKSPFSVLAFLKGLLGTWTFDPRVFKFKQMMADWASRRVADVRGLQPEELSKLTDRELKRYLTRQHEIEVEYGAPIVMALTAHLPALLNLLLHLLTKWYDGGDSVGAYTRLISGSVRRTDTQIENHALWMLSQVIRGSSELSALFASKPGVDFFRACEDTVTGRRFLEQYQAFRSKYAHRGHADRDIIYDRRGDNPGQDYPALQALLTVKAPVDPHEQEALVNERREATLADVLKNVRAKPLGMLRVEAIKLLYHTCHDYLEMRDNERQFPTDMIIMSYKRGYVELGNRLHQRGLLESPGDVYFLGCQEAYELLDGHTRNLSFIRTKLRARKRNVERRMRGEAVLPKYISRGHAVDLDPKRDGDMDASGAYIGTATSGGVATGRACVVRNLAEIGRVQEGDILIANSTDPGWTPVFLVIKGVVVETGGTLSHASCLAREYGFPAVQVEQALSLIPDGATIRVDGNAGTVSIVDDERADTASPRSSRANPGPK